MGAAETGGGEAGEGTLISGVVLVHVSVSVSDGTPVEDDDGCACIGSEIAKDETGGVDRDGDGGLGGEPVRAAASEDRLSATVPVTAVALVGLPALPSPTTS